MDTPTRGTAEPFRGSLAVRLGLLTKDRLRGPDFRRLHRDTYVGSDTDVDVRMRVQALDVWSRGRAVVAGPLAALAFGADCPWEDAEVVLPSHCRLPPEGLGVRTDLLPDDEVAERFGCRITSPVRTAFDLARRPPTTEAVAAVDSLARVGRFSAAHLTTLAGRHPSVRGAVQVRTVLGLMDPRAESLPETRLRVGLLERGVPPGVPQLWVTLRNGDRKRLDLAWPESMVALEYDGPEHRSITGQNRDAFDRARLEDLGWNIGVVTSAMLADARAFDELAGRVRRKVGCARTL